MPTTAEQKSLDELNSSMKTYQIGIALCTIAQAYAAHMSYHAYKRLVKIYKQILGLNNKVTLDGDKTAYVGKYCFINGIAKHCLGTTNEETRTLLGY
jgi:hypothetical protein